MQANAIRNMHTKRTAIDLFSGCGGMTQGLKMAGFRVLGAIELDPLAAETYKKNHPRVKVWENDIRDVPASRLLRQFKLQPGELDLLAGCPPCQGFSSITTLNGHYRSLDSQNDLIFEFMRFVRVLRPRAIMLENVPGLAKDRRLKKVVFILQSLGYKCTSAILDAAEYGVPQRRRRFILMASRTAVPRFGHRTKNRRTVRTALAGIDNACRDDLLHHFSESRSKRIENLIRLIPKNGGSRLALGRRHQLECHKRSDGFKDVYGRMAWDDVAPTITGGCCNPSKGRFLHPSKNRCITLREAAVLQSFPLKYFFSLRRGKFAVAQMIGNALPPEFIRRHAIAVRHAIQKENS